MTTTVLRRGSRFTTADRCDRCGAQAAVLVVLHSDGGSLLLCDHHGRVHQPVLTSVAECFEDHIDWVRGTAELVSWPPVTG